MEMFHLRIFKYRNAYASEKDVRWNQPTYKRYDKCLVTWKFSSCTSSPAGFLTHRSSHKTAFPKLSRQFIQLSFFLSDRGFAHGLVFPAHSDEIVQVFHLFPFYLLSPVLMNFFTAAAAPDASSIVMGDILALQKLLCNRLYKKRGQIF